MKRMTYEQIVSRLQQLDELYEHTPAQMKERIAMKTDKEFCLDCQEPHSALDKSIIHNPLHFAHHTPGPWKYLDGVILSKELNDYGNWHVAKIQKGEVMTKQDVANAYLIAAAPDLLEALIDVVAMAGSDSPLWELE